MKTLFKMAIPISLFALVALGLVFGTPLNINTATTGAGQGLKENSIVQIYVNGKLWDQKRNIITNFGKDMVMAGVFYARCSAAATNIGLGGNTTPMTVTDVGLENEFNQSWPVAHGMNKSAATLGWSGTGTLNLTLTHEFTAASAINVNSTGLFNATTDSLKPFAEVSFTNAALQANDKLNVTWYVWVA